MNTPTLRYHKIEARSYVDGPGARTVLFLQGCTLACPGCQNRHLWPATGGNEAPVSDLAESLALLNSNITISGGEPMEQPEALAALLWHIHRLNPDAHVTVYSGYTWEELFNQAHPAHPWLKAIIEHVNVLVDGRFVKAQDDALITWRGSRNQRAIDVQASLSAGRVVALDWNPVIIQIADDGTVYLPAGAAGMLAGVAPAEPTRMCGQTKGK